MYHTEGAEGQVLRFLKLLWLVAVQVQSWALLVSASKCHLLKQESSSTTALPAISVGLFERILICFLASLTDSLLNLLIDDRLTGQ